MLDPERPPVRDAAEALRQSLPNGDVSRVVTTSEDLILVYAKSFEASMLLDRDLAYAGHGGYGVVVELESAERLRMDPGAHAANAMLGELTPEGVLAWIRQPASIVSDENHRQRPATTKLSPELRAHLASDAWRRNGEWDPNRPIAVQITEPSAYRQYLFRGPSQAELDEAGTDLTLQGQEVLEANTAAWKSLEAKFVQTGAATVRGAFRRNGSGTETKVVLSFRSRNDFKRFAAEDAVALLWVEVPDAL